MTKKNVASQSAQTNDINTIILFDLGSSTLEVGQRIRIVKGENRYQFAFITAIDLDETKSEYIYKLRDCFGSELANGNYSWFPKSFIMKLSN